MHLCAKPCADDFTHFRPLQQTLWLSFLQTRELKLRGLQQIAIRPTERSGRPVPQVLAHLAPKPPCSILKRKLQLGSAVPCPLPIQGHWEKQNMGDSCSFSDLIERNLGVPAAAHMTAFAEAVGGVYINVHLPACCCRGWGLWNIEASDSKRGHAGKQSWQDEQPSLWRGSDSFLCSPDPQTWSLRKITS